MTTLAVIFLSFYAILISFIVGVCFWEILHKRYIYAILVLCIIVLGGIAGWLEYELQVSLDSQHSGRASSN